MVLTKDMLEQRNENALLKMLSVNSRASLQEISNELHISKTTAYALLAETIKKYGLRFCPEISLENLWRMEFARQARSQTKRGIIGGATEIVANTGFNEYMLTINFEGEKPSDNSIASALGNNYMIQFAASGKGAYDVFAYMVSRTYDDIRYFLDKFNAKLNKYSMAENVNRIWTTHGFFPASEELVQQFNLFDSYKNILLGFIKDGRATFSDIGSKYGQGSTQMLYAYERLVRTGVLKHMTYIEEIPKRKISAIAQISISNESIFEKSKEQWYEDMVKQSEDECVYTYIADTFSPIGSIAIINVKDNKELSREMQKLSSLRGAHVKFTAIKSVLIGSIAVRNFDMRYSNIYAYLESKNKVKKITMKEQKIVETPDLITS
ncbi:MAG: hypothetical protein QXS17_02170 [Candidatus Micrarchaeaceae archaeon]